MALKFKNRQKEPNLKKVLIYGMDGSGKSTFALNYCKENGLNPVCIDIDDTNYTGCPIVELDYDSDQKLFDSIKDTISEISKSEFDTIILDGVTSLLEMLTSKAKGMAAYSDRSKRWNKILQKLLSSKKHLIFIGQADMEVIYTPDNQSSKAVIKVNSMVNEKYYCYIKGDQYLHETKKFRIMENNIGALEAEDNRVKPKQVSKVFDTSNKSAANFIDSPKDIADSIIAELPSNNKNLLFAKMELKKLVDERVLTNKECPPILTELERALA